MNIAFLFNSDHESLGCCYGFTVMERILESQVLQTAERHMRISVGDILTYSAATRSKTPTIGYLVELCRAVYRPTDFDRLNYKWLEDTHGKATVYCWLFQNMTPAIGEALHLKLASDAAYLGAMDVVFSEPLQLSLFRNSLCEKYRLNGSQCSMFYSMGENEDADVSVQDCFKKHGFVVDHEDAGARKTIFDDFDSLDHFRRVEDFKTTFSSFDGLDADRASDLILNLEELHPKLFDAFASAARTISRAETDEDCAQAALSGRRLLESVADYLFPPSDEMLNGRKVGQAEYKNRLWAYIERAVATSGRGQSLLVRLGSDADQLFKVFNKGLHASLTKVKVEAAFVALVTWLSDVIALSPSSARRPYLAYNDSFRSFVEMAVRNRPVQSPCVDDSDHSTGSV